MAELLVLNGACAGTVFFLPDVPTVVGRSPESHLQILDPWVSSMHAMFELRKGDVWVVDLESRNGTFVGERRVTEARLEPGAILRFGKTEVRFDRRDEDERPERLFGPGNSVVRYLDDLRAELAQARWADPRLDTVRADAPTVLARRQLAALEELGRALVDAPDLDGCLSRVLGTVAQTIRAERSTLLLADERGTMIPRVVQPASAPPAFSSTLVAAAVQSRAGILTLDAQDDARFRGRESIIAHGHRSVLCVPLWASDRVIGVLLFDRPRNDPFTAEDLDVTAVVGNQAAFAIEWARFVQRYRAEEARRRALEARLPPEVAHAAAEPHRAAALAIAPRVATVVHALLHGAEALPAQPGTAPLAQRVRAALDALAAAARAEGGAVTGLGGAGVVAVFGLAAKDEEAPVRAARAAAAMREALRAAAPGLALRAGIDHGEVLAGNVAGLVGFELAVLGGAADRAAALAAAATGGEILVGDGARHAGITDVVASGERMVGTSATPVFRLE